MPRPRKATSDAEQKPSRYANQSTLAVSKDIADRIRDAAKENDTTAFEIANQLLDYALTHASVQVEVRKVTLKPLGRK